ncbi:hypothetical protein BPOR_0052g00060 [Botrytis porri]|uniref:Uncharacterized protein n=1 Tax=Botrytis porri TaxID=87229 RepID=A0A4Z1L2C3_9HELO|nr:hypothetical protein BPOR_0052g00060 [Botrytis porri]
MEMAVKAAVIVNNSHSSAPKAVATMRILHGVFPVEYVFEGNMNVADRHTIQESDSSNSVEDDSENRPASADHQKVP